MMRIIEVKLKNNPYKVYIGNSYIKNIPTYLSRLNLGDFGIIITSRKIFNLYKKLIERTFRKNCFKVIILRDGEAAKSTDSFFAVINKIAKIDGLNKKIFVICLGGGTIGDIGGFVASIYKRGVPYVQIPTTLLAQIDSSIGGKTAINLPLAKNILGTFYQPKAVFIDRVFLNTLPLTELKQGLAEAIKYGVIKNPDFFYFLKNNHKKIIAKKPECMQKIIETSTKIKIDIVEKDEKETRGIRTILNFGHTFGHALESSLGYRNVSHGEAIALGMLYAAKLSFMLNYCDRKSANAVEEIIKSFSLYRKINYNHRTLYKAISYDKKFVSGKIRMVLLEKIGKVKVKEGLSSQNIKKALTLFSKQ
jgi:3-dehydroquinate synthase